MLQQLEYLVALSTERHFGRAARACHVTQPALSAGIRKLERELGLVIVNRSRRFDGFTDEGRQVVTWARRIVAEHREMLVDVDRLKGQITATARIGAIPTSMAVLPRLTAELQVAHPAVRTQVLTLPSREIARLLTEFELDAAVTYLDSETPPGTRRLELYRERYVLLASEDEPLMAEPVVSWAEAGRLAMCALTQEMRNRRMLETIMASHKVEFRPLVEANTVDALIMHLRPGGLAAVVSDAWLSALHLPPGVAARPLTPQGPGPAVGLITLDRDHRSVMALAVLEAAERLRTRLESETWRSSG